MWNISDNNQLLSRQCMMNIQTETQNLDIFVLDERIQAHRVPTTVVFNLGCAYPQGYQKTS
jgi:hypothetical protein